MTSDLCPGTGGLCDPPTEQIEVRGEDKVQALVPVPNWMLKVRVKGRVEPSPPPDLLIQH